ncbi:MAG: Bug family tripartite tricarboxylate transporter substrate binding protein [Pseudorhodoplanes sp.]|uniref:Bug family tripartite tricarboxylate transporter substrate binding protein n=1 Tax=Pseudorhodoplanes sp. TaxID=1934341 RepID=UPI003D0F7CD3
MLRRIGIGVALLFAAIAAANTGHSNERYPSQPVRIIVPFGPGSLSDIMARIVADGLSAKWKQQVIVENRPGVAGSAAAAKVAPDGYTLMITSNGHTVIGLTNKNLPFDPVKDFTGITRISSLPMSLIVNLDVPAENLKELVALAKASPGKLNFTSPGLASTAYIAAALFRQHAHINVQHIPYKSAPESLTAILRGDAQMYFAAVNLALEQVQGKKVRVIAMATEKRVADMPNVPTFREAGLEFVYDSWFGLMAPAGVKPEILQQLNRDTIAVLQSPETQARMAKQSAMIVFDEPGAFDKIIREETDKMASIFKTQ